MDYHLDWIYASLCCFKNKSFGFIAENKLGLNSNQEDIDLLIAFPSGEVTHLIMIEAKAESGWTNKQFESKADKLEKILGQEYCLWQNIVPHFFITSPRKPLNLNIKSLPAYLYKKIDDLWLELKIPINLFKITRCDEYGNKSKDGYYWKPERT